MQAFEFMGSPDMGNHGPSLRNQEGATTIPKGSRGKRLEAEATQNG